MQSKIPRWQSISTCLTLFLALRLWPYFHNDIPLGYDPGLYRFAFTHFPFQFQWLTSMYPPGLPFLVRLFHQETALIPLIITFSLLLFVSVYIFTYRYFGNKAAMWATFLLACSLVQYRVYYWYYLKNIIALAFLLLAMASAMKKSYWTIFWGALVVYFHTPTDFILYAGLVSGALFMKNQRRYYLSCLGLILGLASPYLVATFKNGYLPLLGNIVSSHGEPSGTFYEPAEILVLSILYVPLGLIGFWKKWRFAPALVLPTIGLFITSLFQLYFYRRLLIYLDLFLLIFAASFIAQIKNKILLTGYVIASLVYVVFFVKSTAYPQIDPGEFQEIKSLQTVSANSYLLVTDQAYMPWAYGYSNHKVIAPGFGENDIWTTAEWQRFWTGTLEEEINLLQNLPQPLLIFHSDRQPILPFVNDMQCFDKLDWRTYVFVCN